MATTLFKSVFDWLGPFQKEPFQNRTEPLSIGMFLALKCSVFEPHCIQITIHYNVKFPTDLSNQIASPNTDTMQYIVLFSQRTVQLPSVELSQ